MLCFDDACSVVEEPIWYEAWRADFAASEAVLDTAEFQVPVANELASRCRELDFPDSATRTLVEQRFSLDEPRVRRLAAHAQWLQAERYTPAGYLALGWPPPPGACPLLYAYAAMGVAPRTRARNGALGIDPAITTATLWDIGHQIPLHQRLYGSPGMGKGYWITHHLASHLFRLGRLQFQRAWPKHLTGLVPAGAAVLDVHIPEDGRLSLQACDESFATARAFFARHFPADGARWFVCSSWLLDPQLAEILPEDSNIVSFQRRFQRVTVDRARSGLVFEFVFYRPDLDRAEHPDVSELPRRTRVERALIEHYESGGRIYPGTGVIAL